MVDVVAAAATASTILAINDIVDYVIITAAAAVLLFMVCVFVAATAVVFVCIFVANVPALAVVDVGYG